MRTAAFFDLDGTLLLANSGSLWMHRERRMGRLTTKQTIQGFLYISLYKFGFVDMEKVMDEALKTIKGEEEITLRRWTRAWFQEEVIPHVAPASSSALEYHRKREHPLILLTSSSPYESEAALEYFNMDDFLSMTYEVLAGSFTGKVQKPMCYGKGKVYYAEEYAREHDLNLEKSYFYSDSITDLPMLERVGHPIAVSPDIRLRKHASDAGWPIMDWSQKTGFKGP